MRSVLISPRRSTSSAGSASPSTSWKVKARACACNGSAPLTASRGLSVRKRSRISPFSTLRCTASRVCAGGSHIEAANDTSSSAASVAAARSGAPNFSSNRPARRSTMACRSASLASVTIASVDQPRLSIPRKPERSATRCFWSRLARSRFQNTKAPETAHSPGSAARSNTKVSDGSSLMVRGNFNICASSEFRTALARIVPGNLRERIHKAAPVGWPTAGRRLDQKIAIEVDAAALAFRAPGKPREIIHSDRIKTPLVPAVEGGHQMARETADDRFDIDHLKTFAQQRNAGGGLHFFNMSHVGRAQDDAEHQPRRYLILGTPLRPAEPRATEQSAVKLDRVGPAETHLALRRAVGGDRVAHGVHAGKECAARRSQRLVRFQHHGEFDQVIAPHPNQRPGTRIGCDIAAMRKRIANFAQSDQIIAGRQIEGLFQAGNTRGHRTAHPVLCNSARYANPAKAMRRTGPWPCGFPA